MILENLKLGTLETNCFLIGCKDTKEAAVIDPGGEVELILEKAAKHNLKIKYIINTHGHIDHIEGNKALHEATGADILIHKEDSGMLTNPLINGSILFFGKTVISPTASRFIDEGDIIKVGNLNLEVLYTPGHTKGGISIKLKNRVYVGDTLFYLSIGRTDLPGGSYKRLLKSINEKLMTLPDDTYIYPGHGQFTTVGYERRQNPFIV